MHDRQNKVEKIAKDGQREGGKKKKKKENPLNPGSLGSRKKQDLSDL
jgi:hypothetical protein